ncbi:hypothetical protein ANTRET_LOCUS184 [Anthophora retusa]
MKNRSFKYRRIKRKSGKRKEEKEVYVYSNKNGKTRHLLCPEVSTQSPSNFCTVPDAPYLWKVHLVTFGNTRDIGSILSSGSISVNFTTSEP